MTSHIRTAIGAALIQLKKGDVLGATSLIKQSLGIGSDGKRPPAINEKTPFVEPKVRVRSSVERTAPSSPGHQLFDALMPDLSTNQTRRSARSVGADNFKSRTYHSNAGSVGYKLYVPECAPAQPVALIMMLHGCTQNPNDFARGTGMNGLADEFGFIVVYPEQPRAANPQGCWNWFDDRHQHRGSGEPVLLAGLAQEVAREFKIDNKRIFAAGLSAGGAMADVLASTYPDVFAGVGVHSGLPAGAATNMMSALGAMKGAHFPASNAKIANGPFVRKIIFHGDSDMTVTASNGATIFDQTRLQKSDVAELMEDTKVNGRRVTRTSVQDGDGHSLVEHWVIHGSGHAWAGGQKGGSYVDFTGPDASREMVRFFLQQ